MSDHPIEALMKTAMESIKEMVDVNTVVGNAVETPGGTVIIPISRVACGFAAGGGEYESGKEKSKNGDSQNGGGVNTSAYSDKIPFGGGSGAGVSVQPAGFLVVSNDQIRFLPVDGNVTIDRMIDLAPSLLNQIQCMFSKKDKSSFEMSTEKNNENEFDMQ